MIRTVLLLGLALWARQADAAGLPENDSLCEAAMAGIPDFHLPSRLLWAVAMVESGRPQPGGTASPWPWTINVAGIGHYYETKPEAIAAVRAAQAIGIRSIDVGCMQINLPSHPQAFASLDDAFDPILNVRYGASFLQRLHGITGDWAAAVAAYHSSTPEIGADYTRRVAAIWPPAAAYAARRGIAVATLQAVRTRLPEVDRDHVMTPEFRARLVEAVAFRRTRDLAMGLPNTQGGTARPGQAVDVTHRSLAWRRVASVNDHRGLYR